MTELRKVMVVDDSSTTAKQLERIIVSLGGYEVVARASNGAEALKLYASLQPDIVCMDINMPVMDGLQALRALMQQNAQATVLMISSLGGVAERAAEALRLGAKEVLSKPFDPEEIQAALLRL